MERIHATEDELQWSGSAVRGPIHPLGALFGRGYLGEAAAVPGSPIGGRFRRREGTARRSADVRSRSSAAAVGPWWSGFDRIVWRENARLTPLPPRLCPVDEVLGGIVSPDSNVILVLNPSALVRRLER